MEAAAKQAGAIVNSVMLGALAASGRLPISAEAFEVAIRNDGKASKATCAVFALALTPRGPVAGAAAALRQAAGEADARCA